jgi:hypothetical protein
MAKKDMTKFKGSIIPLLLGIIIGMLGFGGKAILTKLDENTKAVNQLNIVLTKHAVRIDNVEQVNDQQDKKIDKNVENIQDLEKRTYKLEVKE